MCCVFSSFQYHPGRDPDSITYKPNKYYVQGRSEFLQFRVALTHGTLIYLLLHFLFQIRILYIYDRPDVNKPYLEKYSDEWVKLGQQ